MEKIEVRDEEDLNGSMNCWSDEQICVICMNAISNLSIADTCFHRFCFDCLKRWSLSHKTCPLCWQHYANIRYNIESKTEFNEISINSIRLELTPT